MIRPASEIEYPPSEALCTKARMIVRLEALGQSTEGLMAIIAERISADNVEPIEQVEELQSHAREQQRLIANMKRIVGESTD